MSHRLLLHKLEKYGITRLLNWIKAFLTNRTQRVILGEATSEWSSVTSGVPQGSVLGPLLFLVYINDMPDNIKNACKMYADDTKLISNDENRRELQNDLNELTKWTQLWLMQLNINKCKVMHIGKNNRETKYYLHSPDDSASVYTIDKTISERDLGIQIDNRISFEEQTSKAVGKENNMIGLLKRTFTTRDTKIWGKLYKTYIRPHLEFAVPVWNPYRQKNIDKLEKVQRRETKIPTQFRNRPYCERLKTMGLTSHEIHRHRGDLIQQYKLANGLDRVTWHGLVEQANCTVEGMLTAAMEQHKTKEWADLLPLLMYNLNTSKSWSTKFMPYEIVFNKKPNTGSKKEIVDVDQAGVEKEVAIEEVVESEADEGMSNMDVEAGEVEE